MEVMQVHKSLQALCLADFRVREFIFCCLDKEYSDSLKAIKKSKGAAKQALCKNAANLALQVAFCKKIGFGTTRDPIITAKYLENAEQWRKGARLEHPINEASLQFLIDESREPQTPSNETLREMYDTGIIQPIHQALEFRTSPPAVQEMIGMSRQNEIDALERELGATHPAILNLKWTLSTLLMDSFNALVSIKFLHQMVKSLEAEGAEQERQKVTMDRRLYRDLVITKAYRLVSLMKIGPQAAATIEKQAIEIDGALTELGKSNHVVAIMVCGTLADCLAANGRFKESETLFERAKLGTIKMFGGGHPNTVMALTKESDRLVRQGRGSEAINSLGDSLKHMEKLVENNSLGLMPLRDKLAFLLVTAGQYPEAKEVIEETNKLLEIRAPKFHPGKFTPAFSLAMLSDNYREASKIAMQALDVLTSQGEPWPPEDMPNITESPEVMELIGGDAQNPIRPYPDLKIFPINPTIMEAMLNIVIPMQADAVAEARRGANREADRIYHKADKYYLKPLLKHIDEGLGPEPWIGLSKVGGLNGSPMRRAMDEERTPLVEILVRLGDKGLREGVHYDKAILAAKDLNLPKVVATLEEHRDLCAVELGPDAPLAFQDIVDLESLIAGCWKGAYLYNGGSTRIDPKGHVTFNLTPARDGVSGDRIKVSGRGRYELGNLDIRGDVRRSGKVVVRISREGNDENEGWELVGFINQERRAMGGYWGFPKTTREQSVGTFFFFKCDAGESDVDG
jgi:tetratricopeptide (TPR) repeat protein